MNALHALNAILACFFIAPLLASALAYGMAREDGDKIGQRLMLTTGAISMAALAGCLWGLAPN